VRVATAGCELRVAPARDVVEFGVPVLPPDCDGAPAAGADDAGAEDEGAVAGRVGLVTIDGATGLGAGGLVTRGGVGAVTGGVVTVTGGVLTVTGGVLTVTGGGEGAGGSAVVTGSEGGGGGGGSAVVTGSGGGGGSAVVTGSDGVVTVTPGRGGALRASACAATKPARAATKPQRLPKRDIPKLQRSTPANGCGRVTYAGVLSSSASGLGAGTGSCVWSWPCSWSCE
jgi:hypothetical protein